MAGMTAYRLFKFITDFIGLHSAGSRLQDSQLSCARFSHVSKLAYFTGIDTTISSSITYMGIIKEQFATIN